MYQIIYISLQLNQRLLCLWAYRS